MLRTLLMGFRGAIPGSVTGFLLGATVAGISWQTSSVPVAADMKRTGPIGAIAGAVVDRGRCSDGGAPVKDAEQCRLEAPTQPLKARSIACRVGSCLLRRSSP